MRGDVLRASVKLGCAHRDSSGSLAWSTKRRGCWGTVFGQREVPTAQCARFASWLTVITLSMLLIMFCLIKTFIKTRINSVAVWSHRRAGCVGDFVRVCVLLRLLGVCVEFSEVRLLSTRLSMGGWSAIRLLLILAPTVWLSLWEQYCWRVERMQRIIKTPISFLRLSTGNETGLPWTNREPFSSPEGKVGRKRAIPAII